jgi:hypothetical protein
MTLNGDNLRVTVNMSSAIVLTDVSYMTISEGMNITELRVTEALGLPLPSILVETEAEFRSVLGNVWGAVIPDIFFTAMSNNYDALRSSIIGDMVAAKHIRSSFNNSATEQPLSSERVIRAGLNGVRIVGTTKALLCVMCVTQFYALLVLLALTVADLRWTRPFGGPLRPLVSQV